MVCHLIFFCSSVTVTEVLCAQAPLKNNRHNAHSTFFCRSQIQRKWGALGALETQMLAVSPRPDLDDVPAIMRKTAISEFGRNFRAS